MEKDRQTFFQGLEGIPIDKHVLFELQGHGFLQTRKWVPDFPFHQLFPKGSQINRYESTAAFVYTQGSCFAFEMNRLCREKNWSTIFSSYGRCVKALLSCAEKMQAHFGEAKLFYRGMTGNKREFEARYPVGSTFVWETFTSVTTDSGIAYDFAGASGIIFIIRTTTRGAPILQWSKYPFEEEYLLMPFEG